jgi:GT2 family glycosyltransferase
MRGVRRIYSQDKMKICIDCKEEKDIHEFAIKESKTQRRHSRCKSCTKIKYEKNKHIILKNHRERRLRRYDHFKEKERTRDYKKAYNLSIADYDRLFEIQDGKCAICGTTEPGNINFSYFAIDHDHNNKKVRGLLCNKCNRGLGFFKDNFETLYKAYKYLKDKNKMKAILCMAVYDTDDNKRTEYTEKTIYSLLKTANLVDNKLIIIDNNSCQKTKLLYNDILNTYSPYFNIEVIYNDENEGTASAINKGIRTRVENQYIVKIDNDVEIFKKGWVEDMIYCFEKDETIGVLGLKRPDIPNCPTSKEYPTKLEFLKRELGDPWHVIEWCDDIIGTVHMYSPKLLKEVGYLWQPSCYGFDDVLMSERSLIAGFRNAFYPSVHIEHIDTTPNPYWDYKRKQAGLYLSQITGIIESYKNGTRSIYYSPFDS